jgi:hypothetical protein
MPKSKRRKGAKERAGGTGLPESRQSAGASRRNLAILAVVILLGAGYLGYDFWQGSQGKAGFDALAAEGRAALAGVDSHPAQPNSTVHLRPGETHAYGESFPTSGPHDATPTNPGFYRESQPARNLVHALEHGHVVIYYEAPGEDALATLRDWAGLFTGHWDGLVVTPKSGLGPNLILTAWRKRLDLQAFDGPAIAAFVDAFRGRGPENPVR